MKWPIKFWLCFSAILIIAIVLRLWQLDVRPMHGDEAVHAARFGPLLEENYYHYDPQEFHGPTLNYFTLVAARLYDKHSYARLTESTLRITPALFGLLLAAMPLLLTDGLGRPIALVAAALTAISPAFCFYSRYYIPEMLLVCFTFGMIACGYRYVRSGSWVWALLAGVFAGLCWATKETCIIAFGATLTALAVILAKHRQRRRILKVVKCNHLLLAGASALIVWALFYSSFFTNPAGLLDSFRSYAVYFSRAGSDQSHIRPLYYYLKLLTYNKTEAGPPWTEAFIVFLAVAGFITVLSKRGVSGLDFNLLNFLALYTVIMTVVYSAIPYKTPWCLLSFYHGMILLAAAAIVAILKSLKRMLSRLIIAAFFATAATDLLLQALVACFISYADPANPYVYAHPTKDVLKVASRVEQLRGMHPAGYKMPIWVVCTDGDYWPLPWYLRSFESVGWCSDANEIRLPADIVIASAAIEDAVVSRLYDLSPPGSQNLYVPLFDNYVQLRPNVELRGLVTKDLLDKYKSSVSEDAAASQSQAR
jgi:uncharacterized protein (TIGR03663 family)